MTARTATGHAGRPSWTCPIEWAVAEQEGSGELALATQIGDCRIARSDQVTDSFVNHIRNPSRGQLAGARQLGQRHRIPAIGLRYRGCIARALRDQRWRHYDAGMAERDDLPIKPVAGGPGLVDRSAACRTCRQASQPAFRPPPACWRCLAQIPHLAGASGFCYRHSVRELRAINHNENFPDLRPG